MTKQISKERAMQLKYQLNNKQQTNSNQSSGTKRVSVASVKTPSLLFYRPSVNSTRKTKSSQGSNQYQSTYSGNNKVDNKLPRQGSANVIDHTCENHHKVPARYVSHTGEEDDPIYYCERCANLLLGQGFQVKLLSQHDGKEKRFKKQARNQEKIYNNWRIQCYPYPERQHQVESFLGSLGEAREEITLNAGKIRDILISSEEFYGQQIEEINEYFETIAQSLELQKNKCYNHILLQRQNAQKNVRDLIGKLREGEKEIESMVVDIEQNLDSVYSISWQNYKLVIDAFKTRIREIDKMLNQIRENGIMDTQYRKIEFAGVPESINSLSDIIIQNSYGTVQGSDGALMFGERENGSLLSDKKLNSQGHSLYDRLKVEQSSDSMLTKENAGHMMFSFSSEKIRSCMESQCKEGDQNNPVNSRATIEHDQQPIKLIRNKSSVHLSKEVEKVQTVAGIKQVEEVDALVMDDDDITFPPSIRFTSR